jgi:hypothetical protein
LNDLVGCGQQRFRDGEPERLGGFDVDDQLELGGLCCRCPAADAELKTLQTSAEVLGLKLHVLHASTERDIDAAFASLAQLGAGGLVINDDPFLLSRIELVAALSLQHKMPTMFENREFVAAGGVIGTAGPPQTACPSLKRPTHP